MPSREVVYRVQLDTASARREAAGFRRQIQQDLGGIDLNGGSSNSRSTGTRQAATATDAFTQSLGGLNKALGLFGIALGAQQITQFTIGLGSLATEAARARVAFDSLSGGAAQATANINAIQRAGGGAISSLDAIKIGNQAAALSLANTADEFERVTRAGRVVALISPVINDVSSAISELGLASANLSFRRLDQLGLSVEEVRSGMARLQAENENLSDSQAFLEASMDALIAKGGEIVDSAEAQATGFERLGVAIEEARVIASKGPIGGAIQTGASALAGSISEFTVQIAGAEAGVQTLNNALESGIKSLQDRAKLLSATPIVGDSLNQATQREIGKLQEAQQILNRAAEAVGDDPSLINYQQQIAEIVASVVRWGDITDNQIDSLRLLNQTMERQQEINAPSIAADNAAEQARQAEEARQALIAESGAGVNTALSKRASEAASTIGIERAITTLNEQKQLVDDAIQNLIDSSIQNPDELQIRLDQINEKALGFFDEVEAMANDFSFDGMDTAFANIFDNLNFGDIDFLPGLQDLRDEVFALYDDIAAAGGSVTEEQAALLDYYSAAASAAADESSLLGGVLNQLGGEYLANNQLAGELISQMLFAEAAYQAGQISASNYAGQMAALGGQLLAYIGQTGAATSATYALIAAQSGLQGTAGYKAGSSYANAIGSRLQAQDDERARARARQEAERAQKEAQRAAERAAREAESAAKRAAREQESAAKRAARELEQGAKRAAQELQSALGNVPGLFGRSDVTQQQLDRAESGLPQNFADDYIRRLEDEVFNGNDWADVSIEEARAALERVGIQASDDAKLAFGQFAEAWESSVLFSDKANLDFINQEAVQLALDLQERAKQGQENIYELFGASIEQAYEAVGAGIESAGGVPSATGGYTLPITAQLIPATEGLQNGAIPTLGGISPVLDIAAIQGQLDTLSVTITPSLADGAGTSLMDEISAQSATVTVKSKLDYGDLADDLSFIGSQMVTVQVKTMLYEQSFVDLLTTIGTTKQSINVTGVLNNFAIDVAALGKMDSLAASISDRIKNAIGANIGTTQWADGEIVAPIADGLISAINTQIRGSTDGLSASGGNVADIIRNSIASSIGTTQWADGEIVAPIADGLISAINTQVRGSADGFESAGAGISALMMQSVANGFSSKDAQGNSDNGLALAMAGAINSQMSAIQNFFYAAGQVPAQNVINGYKSYFSTGTSSEGGTPLVTPMITAINSQIRANSEALQAQGYTMATYVANGFSRSFQQESFQNTVTAAGALMGKYLENGILSAIDGGAIADAIGAKVVADISAEVADQ